MDTEEYLAKRRFYAKQFRLKNPDKVKASRRKYYEKNKEKIKEKWKEYRKKNRDIILAKLRAYNSKVKVKEKRKKYMALYLEQHKEELYEKGAEYRAKNRNKINVRAKLYNFKNSELRKRKAKKFYWENRELMSKKSKIYRNSDKGKETAKRIRGSEKAKQSRRLRRERLRNVQGSHSLLEWHQKLLDSKGYCCYCHKYVGVTNLVQDHVTPISKGGTNHIGNINASCFSCNAKKQAKNPIVFAQELFLRDSGIYAELANKPMKETYRKALNAPRQEE